MTKYDLWDPSANERLESATFEWKQVKVSPHPQGTGQRAQHSAGLKRKRRRDMRKRIQIVVTYVGGPEASFTVSGDGKTWRYPGHRGLYDVMTHFVEVVLP